MGFWLLAAALFACVQKWRGGELAVLRFLVIGSVTGAALVVLLVARSGFGIETLAGILVYAFLCELYIFLFTLVRTSIGASILLALRSGRAGPAEDDGAAIRIERLVGAGLAAREGEGYVVTPRGERLLRAFAVLRRFFGHGGANGT